MYVSLEAVDFLFLEFNKNWNVEMKSRLTRIFLFCFCFFLLWCFQLTSRVIVRSRKGLYWSYISKQQVNKAPYWVQNLVPLDLNLTWYLFRLMHCWIWLLNNNETWGLRVQPSQAKKIRRYRSLFHESHIFFCYSTSFI